MDEPTKPDEIMVDFYHSRQITAISIESEPMIGTKGYSPYYEFDRIEPYYENGEMAPVLWFALFNEKGEITRRINGKYVVSVYYGKDAP